MKTTHTDPVIEAYCRFIEGLAYGPGLIARVPLTKKLLFGLNERHWIWSNCCLFNERVAPRGQRLEQWNRIKGGAGRLCEVWDTSVPDAGNGIFHPWLDAAWTLKEGEGQ